MYVRLVGAETDFATLHRVYGWMVDGINYTPRRTASPAIYHHRLLSKSRAEHLPCSESVHRGIHQQWPHEEPPPDILLYVNGLPLHLGTEESCRRKCHHRRCVGTDQHPVLARHSAFAPLLSAGFASATEWKHVWHRTNTPTNISMHGAGWTMATRSRPWPSRKWQPWWRGVYAPKRFLEIFRDYIYFQDKDYDDDEREISAAIRNFCQIDFARERCGISGSWR